MDLELCVVIPSYNEEERIKDTLNDWLAILSMLKINFKIMVLNDTSTDRTVEEIESFKNNPRILIIHKEKNTGHGPTILMGYRKAVEMADWIFQCDGDNEIKPEQFPIFWEKRKEYDALLGIRTQCKQNFIRKMISKIANFTVQTFFAKGIKDVNIPYRLLRARILSKIIDHIPPDIFAPNVIISGILAEGRFHVFQHPVSWKKRITERKFQTNWKWSRAAIKSFYQTMKCRAAISRNSFK